MQTNGGSSVAFRAKNGKAQAWLSEGALYEYAVKALGRHMRTEEELRRMMRQRAEIGERGEAAIAAVVKRLKEYGFLNDAAYAETYARLRQENERLGARRVRRDLMQKGLKAQLIEETVTARYGEVDEEKLARQHLERKRIKKPEDERETARVVRRLVTAGFSMGTIYKVLRQWDVPEDTLTALDNLSTEDLGERSPEE
jgi:regulatory protein